MTYYNMIEDALKNKKTACCGNYAVHYDKKHDQSEVSMFGNTIFYFGHKHKSINYDFCGYEGFPKTTRAINYCLDAVGADFHLETKHRKVIEVKKN